MASVGFDNIEKSFGDVRVVKGVSLDIRDREFVALLGPSGCGKTTCLRMLAGLEEPDSGRVLVADKDVTYTPPRARDIAMVFQNYALYPHMTVRKNLEMGLKYRKVAKPEIKTRIEEAAALMDIGELMERRPAALSGGQRQRVALGRAIVRRPQALLMDEPLSNLDATLRNRMRVELKLLQQRIAVTTLYVTHDQREAMTMADRIAVMDKGQVMQFDTPDRVFRNPANRFVAEFVGSPAVNLLPGSVQRDETGISVTAGTFVMPLAEAASEWLQSRRVEIGIRPHFLKLGRQPGCLMASGRVVAIEPLGTEANIHVALGDATVVLVAEPRHGASVNETVEISCPPSDVYVFDAEDGRLLTHSIELAR